MKYFLTILVLFILFQQQSSTEQCQGTTTQGKRCSRITPQNISYCWEHFNETSITTNEKGTEVKKKETTTKKTKEGYVEGGRCQATTKKGLQCKRSASSGSSTCWQH